MKYQWGNLGALYTQRVYYQDCTLHSTKIAPNKPKGNTKKKMKWEEREVEMEVKFSEELIYCTIAIKLYSHLAANINKQEFSSPNLCRGNQRSLRNNTSFLWILELQVTICNFCNYPLSRLDFLLSSVLFCNQSTIWDNLKIVKLSANMAIVVSSTKEMPEAFSMLYSCLKWICILSILMCVKTNMLYSIDLSSNMWLT